MEHVRVRNFTETGRRLPDVVLPLSKSEVAVAILRRIAKGSDEMDGDTLADLDSGRIHFSTLAKLFQRSELERAVKIRLADVDLGPDEREQLLSLLKFGKRAWSASMGGEHAHDRFGIGRNPGRDPEGKGSIRKSRERDALVKSQLGELSYSLCKAYGWRPQATTGDGGLSFMHKALSGHSLDVSPGGEWEHRERGGRVTSGGPGKLNGHLASVTKSADPEDPEVQAAAEPLSAIVERNLRETNSGPTRHQR